MTSPLNEIVQTMAEMLKDQQAIINRLQAKEMLHNIIILRLLAAGAMGGVDPSTAQAVEQLIDSSLRADAASDAPGSADDLVELLRASLDQPHLWQPVP